MGVNDDRLFGQLESPIQRERAIAILEGLREVFVEYVTAVGPGSAQEKLDADRDAQPELHSAAALITAQMYVVADTVMTAQSISHTPRTPGRRRFRDRIAAEPATACGPLCHGFGRSASEDRSSLT